MFDLSAAFDTVEHAILSRRLEIISVIWAELNLKMFRSQSCLTQPFGRPQMTSRELDTKVNIIQRSQDSS